MLAWLKRFLFDETAFVGLIRAACIGLGTAVASGMMSVPEEWRVFGVIAASLGGFIRAGEKNKP